jgi:hypothetical protein
MKMRIGNRVNLSCLHMTGRSLCVFAVLVITYFPLSGCAPVPIVREYEEPERISLFDLNGFTIGVTTRQDVQKTIGKPDLRRYNDRLWIYGWAGKSPLLTMQAYTARVLFIEFDEEGVLIDIDLEEGEEACRDDGICIRHWEITEKEWGTYVVHWLMIWRLSETRTIVTAPDKENERIRNYEPDEGVCGLYVFGDISRFAIGDYKDITTDGDTYAFFELKSGKQEIFVYLGLLTSAFDNPNDVPLINEFECGSGNNVYINVNKKYIWKRLGLFPSGLEWNVTFLPPEVGRDKIKKSRLQLLH